MVDLKFENPNLDDLTKLEWLVTNGIGGYASGTLSGVLTRRYHGLLVAALKPPLDRVNMVVKMDEWVTVGGVIYPLFANRWKSADFPIVPPVGCASLVRFYQDGQIPTWQFQPGESEFETKVWMEHGENTTYVQYSNTGGDSEIQLTLKVMLGYTNFHDTNKRRGDYVNEAVANGVRVTAGEDSHPYYLFAPGAEFQHLPVWLEKFYMAVEDYRGLDSLADLYNGVDIVCNLPPGESILITLTTDPNMKAGDLDALSRRRAYEEELVSACPLRSLPEWAAQLPLAADQFIVDRGVNGTPGKTIMAGYHWFSDWGRDTMIALPGLTLATGRFDVAESILRTFAKYIDQGMLPNRFPDLGEEPEYNTIDATLWYFEALYQYYQKLSVIDVGKALKLVVDLIPQLEEIIGYHEKGTRYQIQVDPADGLLYGGEEGVQLTWMDAKVENFVVTPRIGKPVEINGLWYSALRIMAEFSRLVGVDGSKYLEKAIRVKESFGKFWNEEKGFCFDVIEGPGGNDPALRPNQVLAAAVAFSPLDEDRQKRVLEVCEEALLTPYGLRSLAPDEKGYVHAYGGDIWQRDSGYHQGTVWGWLIGPFLTTDYRINRDREKVTGLLKIYCENLNQHGLGSISEIFDAEAPHTSRGCISQAWSVAAALWVLDCIEQQPG